MVSFLSFADELKKIAETFAGLPGVEPGGPIGLDAARAGAGDLLNGLEGRLTKPAVGGTATKLMQGPRSYGPRLKKV